MKMFIIGVMSYLMFYAMFSDEWEYKEPPPEPKSKSSRKPIKVKRNGQWVDEDLYK
jgi:hypothetical protein